MKLYYSPGACSLASHIVAVVGGLELELEKVDLKTHRTETGEDYCAINPKGYVPALRLDDGSLLTENVALLPFLGEKTGLMPDGMARYRALEWLGYISSELHKSFAPLFGDSSDAEKSAAKKKIASRLALVEKNLVQDYLMGGSFSAPDAYLYVMLRWCGKNGIELPGPHLKAFKDRMEGLAGVKAALQQEGQS